MGQIDSSTLSNQSLTTPLLVHTHTATADRQLQVRCFADQVAGNGIYVVSMTIQRLGVGSAYPVLPKAASTSASGETAAAFVSRTFPIKNTDVLKVYLIGLAGDTATPDIITEIWEATANVDKIEGTDATDQLDARIDARLTAFGVSTYAGADTDGTGTLLTRLSLLRAGYLDNLSGGAVALQADVLAIQNNTRVVFTPPLMIERPDSGTETYQAHLLLYDEAGNMETPDSPPTLTLTNPAGTDRSSRLDSVTMALVSTGHYKVVYTADAADALEELEWTASVVEGGATRVYYRSSLIVDTTAVDFTSADRTTLGLVATAAALSTAQTAITAIKVKTDNLPSDPADQSQVESAISATQTAIAAAITALNNLSAANVQTAATASLNAYDGPTHAEMTAELGVLQDHGDAEWGAGEPADCASTQDVIDARDHIETHGDSAWRTQTTPASPPKSVTGPAISQQRGDKWIVPITDLGDLTGCLKLWVTLKKKDSQADAAATLMVELEVADPPGGITRLNGTPYGTTTNGAIEIDNGDDGDITVTVLAAATALLEDRDYAYDVQGDWGGGDVRTLSQDTWSVTADITRATS